MKLFDVYPLYDVEIVKGCGSRVWDADGNEYLDLYGGHAVISIGHAHPRYVSAISEQVARLGFYSNSVINSVQSRYAEKVGEISGLTDYTFFMCNSGAEANENAVKLASFITGKDRVISFSRSFHGRTSLAVAITDNPKIVAPVNDTHHRTIVALNDIEAVRKELAVGDVCAVIIEGIQGVGGMGMASDEFMKALAVECKKAGVKLILDEVQSGCGRTGRYFAFQHYDIMPDIISVAKGIGNGFPMAGILIAPDIEARHGMLGTTFGGNHLACAAGSAVIDVIMEEHLMENAARVGAYAAEKLSGLPHVVAVKGRGLMLGVEFDEPIAAIRRALVFDKHIFTGAASNPCMIRILPPLCISEKDIDTLYDALLDILK
ncbi:MAG: aminotransferase class III-fold pyridoxal phosphate-dependent enzyme [Flavobacteriales bacterium]|nr:aminotransferase class III-fold pyridoxal phosphate-dependent enzyme [Flavobacteriales bacterium]